MESCWLKHKALVLVILFFWQISVQVARVKKLDF